jgi:hypothetical protein
MNSTIVSSNDIALVEIFTSWLNSNLAKSQSGSYVPISIAKDSIDFFVVTARGNIGI